MYEISAALRVNLLRYWEADLESAASSECPSIDEEHLQQLNIIAPELSYETAKEQASLNGTGSHLAWPDSFYEW